MAQVVCAAEVLYMDGIEKGLESTFIRRRVRYDAEIYVRYENGEVTRVAPAMLPWRRRANAILISKL